jgi:hypothetical protein
MQLLLKKVRRVYPRCGFDEDERVKVYPARTYLLLIGADPPGAEVVQDMLLKISQTFSVSKSDAFLRLAMTIS